jgi:transposase
MESEMEVNNRRLTAKEQEQLRMRIIRTAKKNLKPNGKPHAKRVAEICECSSSHVRGTWKKYSEGGVAAIKAVTMERPVNSGELGLEQQKTIQKMIVDKCPEQLKLPGVLWDSKNIRDLIKQLFKVTLTLQAISKYLKKWGYTPQRPIKRHDRQNPEQIKRWLDEEYPKIKQRAKDENAEIMWGDETGCQNETNYVRGYAPKGQTPLLPVGNHRLRVNMISAITNQGKMRFMFYDGTMNAKR